MNLNITGLHVEISDALRNHVAEKMERIARHHDGVISLTVTLSAEKHNHKAAAQAHLAGKDFHVEATQADMYAAVDVLADKLNRAIVQYKKKQNSRH